MIEVDFKGIPSAMAAILGPEVIPAILDDVAAAARAKWIQLAQRNLGSSKRAYIQGIQEVIQEGPLSRIIELLGWLPNAVETGIDAYDLRTTLLNDNAKVAWSKAGRSGGQSGHRYRAIPFRHTVPGGAGEIGAVMGARYGPQGPQSEAWAAGGVMSRSAAVKMGKAIYEQARKLEAKQRLGHYNPLTGRRSTYFIGGTKKNPELERVPKLAPWHSTDIFAGMRRERKTYEKATQSQYVTFRTISEAVETGWIHPGIQARHLRDQVEQHIQSIVGKIVQASVKSAIKGVGR